MAESRTISKTGAELQDIVEILDQTTGEFFLPFTDFEPAVGASAVVAQVGGTNFSGYAFDDTTGESVVSCIRIPSSLPAIDVTKDISLYYIWSAAATSGDVVFTITLRAVAIGEDVGGSGTTLTATDTAAGTADFLSQSPVMTISGSTVANSDLLFVDCGRNAGDAGDTMTGDAVLHGIRISYTTNPNIV